MTGEKNVCHAGNTNNAPRKANFETTFFEPFFRKDLKQTIDQVHSTITATYKIRQVLKATYNKKELTRVTELLRGGYNVTAIIVGTCITQNVQCSRFYNFSLCNKKFNKHITIIMTRQRRYLC